MARPKIRSSAEALRLLIATAALCTAAQAVEFAAGTGQPNDPYQIATAEQLIAISDDPNLYNRHFVLVADLDLDPNLAGGQLLSPGLVLSTGSFDGGGHSIINLTLSLDRRGTGLSALFASIGPGAVVRDLSLEGTFAETGMPSEAGMLASRNEGLIINCHASGTLSFLRGGGLVAENLGFILSSSFAGTIAGPHVGGLVGTNSGTIHDCSVAGEVVNPGWTRTPVGGLVDVNFGRLTHCHSIATVTGGSGLIGENGGTVLACYATGDVTSGPAGLVGENRGTIRYCYATGDVHASGDVAGGLVASNFGDISYSYATGDVSPDGLAGGLVARNDGTIVQCYATGSGGMALVADRYYRGTVLSCYTLSQSSGGGVDDGVGIMLTDAQMRLQGSFVGWDFVGTHRDGSSDHWTMPEDGGYPTLTAIVASGCPGSGTAADPYLVETHHQFVAILSKPQAYYQLVSDIDLQGQIFSEAIIPMFCGHLDGAGHSVSNFVLTGEQGLGLVGTVCSEASVIDLDVCEVYMETAGDEQRDIGALAARNLGLVTDCSATVEMRVLGDRSTDYVAGLIGVNDGGELRRCSARLSLAYESVGPRPSMNFAGGLVGHNTGLISQCCASAYTDSQSAEFGGLVGQNDGTIVDCFADGCFGGYRAAGLVRLNGGNITNCYAAAAVPASAMGAGLVTENFEGVISDSYLLAEADGGGPDNGLGTPLLAVDMRRRASFPGWDFDNTWTICQDHDFPRLQWEPVDCPQ